MTAAARESRIEDFWTLSHCGACGGRRFWFDGKAWQCYDCLPGEDAVVVTRGYSDEDEA